MSKMEGEGRKIPITAIDLSHIYDEYSHDQDRAPLGEFPEGVAISDEVVSGKVIRTDEDFEDEVATNEELKRRAEGYDGFIAVERKSPNKLNLYFAKKLHQITEHKTKALAIGLGAVGAATTIYIVQHEIRKQKVKNKEKTQKPSVQEEHQ